MSSQSSALEFASGGDSHLDGTILKELWREEGLCDSQDELEAIWEDVFWNYLPTIAKDDNEEDDEEETTTTFTGGTNKDWRFGSYSDKTRCLESFVIAMKEYFGLSKSDSVDMFHRWLSKKMVDNKNDEEVNNNNNKEEIYGEESERELLSKEEATSDDEADEQEDLVMREGECELCERFILITRHHLIPRSTWHRLEPKVRKAVSALIEQHNNNNNNNWERVQAIAGDEFSHFLSEIALQQSQSTTTKTTTTTTSSSSSSIETLDIRRTVRQWLQRTCNVCGPCHSTIHRTHDNLTLALQYNTLEKLLDDPTIIKFSKWANKQRTGKYTRHQAPRR